MPRLTTAQARRLLVQLSTKKAPVPHERPGADTEGVEASMPFQYTGAPAGRLDPVAYPVPIDRGAVAVRCVVPGVPMSKQRPRFVRKTGAVFTPRETRDREQVIGAYAQLQAGVSKPDGVNAFGIRAVFYVDNAQRKDTDNMLKLLL